MTNSINLSTHTTLLKKHTGVMRILLAFVNTKKGLVWMLRHESAFRQEFLLLAIALPIVAILNLSNINRALMIGSILIILIVESLNTGLEAAVDRIGLEYHELSGIAKDCGSAAVFLSFMFALLIWSAVLFG